METTAVQGVFYNTTGESGEVLDGIVDMTRIQEGVVYEMFLTYGRMSPSECFKKYAGYLTNVRHKKFAATPPLTSVRRAFNTLTEGGVLVKTADKVVGMYGRKECVWEYVDLNQQ